MTVKVTGYPRIHITLLDMFGKQRYRPGGVGFSINSSPTEVVVSDGVDICGEGKVSLDRDEKHQISAVIRDVAGTDRRDLGANTTVVKRARPHSGYGGKTTLLLSVASAVNEYCGLNLQRDEVVKATGRGGLSGVGVNTFFTGGLVCDTGRLHGQCLQPSGLVSPSSRPLAWYENRELSDYVVGLALPSNGITSQSHERKLFETKLPIGKNESDELYALVFGTFLPSLVHRDVQGLLEFFVSLKLHGFKKYEVEAQHAEVKMLLEQLLSDGIPAGMSSVGPLIFCLLPRINSELIEKFKSRCQNLGVRNIDVTTIRCSGPDIERI